jgi:hypothetical protein
LPGPPASHPASWLESPPFVSSHLRASRYGGQAAPDLRASRYGGQGGFTCPSPPSWSS